MNAVSIDCDRSLNTNRFSRIQSHGLSNYYYEYVLFCRTHAYFTRILVEYFACGESVFLANIH
jgi:hypothetical protein